MPAKLNHLRTKYSVGREFWGWYVGRGSETPSGKFRL